MWRCGEELFEHSYDSYIRLGDHADLKTNTKEFKEYNKNATW